jgi:isopentenyldiphosphate isomerase
MLLVYYYSSWVMTIIVVEMMLLKSTSSFAPLRHNFIRQMARKVPSHQQVNVRVYSSFDKHNNIWYEPSLMDHMLFRINECNHIPHDINLVDFVVDGEKLGTVTPKVAERLCNTSPSIFKRADSDSNLTLGKSAGSTPESRTKAVASVMEELRDSGYITGWRDELYPVANNFDQVTSPVFLIERAAASLLGVLEYGVHINGLVMSEDNKEVKMWMARRSKTKSKFPSFLDHIVAGGQPAGLSLIDNVIKECEEEAGIPEQLTKRGIKPVGVISYENYGGRLKDEGEGVMSRVVLFCFDLMLPKDFVPSANDGEVENFFTWSLHEIAQSMHPQYDDPIKPNCYPVIIDWMLREGHISPDSPKYLEIVRRLRSGPCC